MRTNQEHRKEVVDRQEQTGRHTGRQTDRQTDRQRGRQTDNGQVDLFPCSPPLALGTTLLITVVLIVIAVLVLQRLKEEVRKIKVGRRGWRKIMVGGRG